MAPTSSLDVGEAPPALTGLRELKKRRTRRELRVAALRLVAERGLDHVTNDAIAAAAGVSPRTFFNYFSGKEDALVGSDPELAVLLGQALLERPPLESPLQAIREVFVAYASTVTMDEETWRLRMRVVEENPQLLPSVLGASAVIERALTAAIATRTGLDAATHPYPRLVADVAAAAARSAVWSCGVAGFVRPLDVVVGEVFDALTAGLPAPPV